MIKTLYDDRETVIAWIRQMPQSVKQWLQESKTAEIVLLKFSDNGNELCRAQGRLTVIDKFLNMEADLLNKPKQ